MKIRTAVLGRQKREVLVRLPESTYEALVKFAKEEGTSLNYQVNTAIKMVLSKAGIEND